MATSRLCSIPTCRKPVYGRDLCAAHYQRLRKYGDPLGGAKYQITHKPGGPCGVSGCQKPAKKKGMCIAHYERQRLGKPSDNPVRVWSHAPWFREHVSHEGDDCLIWPYATNEVGYGSTSYEGRSSYAHRVMCIMAHGEPPSPDHDAAHSCGNGFGGCVNPRHIRWATRQENILDQIEHGTIARGEKKANAVLTENTVRDIRENSGIISVREMADMYGVSIQTIYAVLSRRNWAWVD